MHKNSKIENLSIVPQNACVKTMDKIWKSAILCITLRQSNEKSNCRAGLRSEAIDSKYKKTIKSQNNTCISVSLSV